MLARTLTVCALLLCAWPGLLACAAPAATATPEAACRARAGGVLPDPACTPGAVDPVVTQDVIGSTICVIGYTTRVRPPLSFTAPLKRELIARYGLDGGPSAYELDHLVPLEVGGAPGSLHNLWPQPRDVHPGSIDKDHLENLLHDLVCGGRITLTDAQRMFETDWLQAWQRFGRP